MLHIHGGRFTVLPSSDRREIQSDLRQGTTKSMAVLVIEEEVDRLYVARITVSCAKSFLTQRSP